MSKSSNEVLTTAARQSVYLSHFTPSMMPAQTLETLLVKRESLIERVVKSAIESVKTDGKHHHLFVGPRGIGKTHVISLLHHRLSQNKTIRAKAKIVWMREEEWGVTSFFELVLRILNNLDQTEPSLGIHAQLKELYNLTVKQAEGVACDLLLQTLSGKTLIILLENLDDLFEQMGDSGQKKWRAFIQNHPQFVMLCTTPALFQGVTSQKSAFYGSFDVEQLDEFSFEEVVELLEKIAQYRDDKELVEFINTAEGRARIRAVHHLAQGNPRIYIIFAQFLSKMALDELVQAFMHTLDELTPYYQARMKELSGQQRKILSFLIQYKGAAAVKDIAKACFVTQQVCSSQLKILKDRRFVEAQSMGRLSYYELREPLMRLCMEVKQQHGEPLSLFVDMLRIWYSQKELESRLDGAVDSLVDRKYLMAAIERMKQDDADPKLLAILKSLDSALTKEHTHEIWDLYVEILELYPKVDDHKPLTLNWLACLAMSQASINRLIKESPQIIEKTTLLVTTLFSDKEFTRRASTPAITRAMQVLFNLWACSSMDWVRAAKAVEATLIRNPAQTAISFIVLFGKHLETIDSIYKFLDELVTKIFQNESRISILSTSIEIFQVIQSGDELQWLRLPIEQRALITETGLYQAFEYAKTKRLVGLIS